MEYHVGRSGSRAVTATTLLPAERSAPFAKGRLTAQVAFGGKQLTVA